MIRFYTVSVVSSFYINQIKRVVHITDHSQSKRGALRDRSFLTGRTKGGMYVVPANEEIRSMKGKAVAYWMIASRLDISEATMTRWMRREMEMERQNQILTIIGELKKEIRGQLK